MILLFSQTLKALEHAGMVRARTAFQRGKAVFRALVLEHFGTFAFPCYSQLFEIRGLPRAQRVSLLLSWLPKTNGSVQHQTKQKQSVLCCFFRRSLIGRDLQTILIQLTLASARCPKRVK